MLHKYSLNGFNIVLDIYSGAIHVVDNAVYDILNYYNEEKNNIDCTINDLYSLLSHKYSKDEINEAYREIRELEEKKLIFTEDTYYKIAQNLSNNSVVKALCLHIAHDCNLRCKYCFGSTGSYNEDRSLMSEEVGKKAIDFVIENSGNRRNIEIDFFGGEPLMNFDIVKKIVEYSKKKEAKYNKNFRFTITTNGILLNDEIIEYVNKNMSNIVLSIDGRKEVHDKMRPRIDNTGTYDDIIDKFIKVAESRNQDNYYVRGTYTKYNLDFSKDILHLADLGFKQISIEPVVADETEDYALTKNHLEKLFNEYDKLANEIIKRKKNGKGFNFFHFMIDLSQGPCVVKRLAGCGAGHEYVAVTPHGDIYPCHQLVGNTEFKVGDVYCGITRDDLVDTFRNTNVYTKEDCKKCWAKFYCSGGCLANAYQFNNDINKPYNLACELERKRVECAIMIQACLNM